ncbi:MAG: hypothetical protein ACI9T7_000659 [Oleiphilaceae bacterium]|jgi:hypothetical protein
MKQYGKSCFFTLITLVCLSGCASNPAYEAATSEKEITNVEDKVQNAKMAWIGKSLLEPSARNRAVEILSDEKLPEEWTASDYSTFASLSTDLAVGQLSSTAGGTLGAAALVLGLMAGDGSEDLVSGMFFPSIVDGVELKTPEQARDVALSRVVAKIHQVAVNTGYSISCIYDCDGYSPIFRFDLSDNIEYTLDCFYSCDDSDAKYKLKSEPFKGNYSHQPTPFTMNVHIGEFEDAVATRALDSLSTGFPVKWKTKGVNGAMVLMRENVAVNAEKVIEVIPAEENRIGIAIVNGWDNYINTPFSRAMYRTIFDNTEHYFGTSASSIFIYNSNTYLYRGNEMYSSFRRIITN